MTVFAIIWCGIDETDLESIWSSRELAKSEVARLLKIHPLCDYHIEEIVVDERGEP